MFSRRTARAAEAIREVVSSTILFGLRDPRVKNVTVLRVKVSPDLQSAKVYVSVRGDEKTQALTMHGLNAARGYLQSKVADRIQTRYTPILKFILDQGVKRSAEATALLKELATDTEGLASGNERNADLDALASLTSGGRPGPIEHATHSDVRSDVAVHGSSRSFASPTLDELPHELDSHADHDTMFTDDDDHQN
jgi:ribosome-binding factor A